MPAGGAVTGVKVNQKEIGSDLYALEDGVLTIEADAFAEVTTTLTVIEVSNDKGTSVIYAHKGAAVATLNAESGAYEEGYDFYVQSTQDGSIVSGKDALSGNYSYYRYGAATKDNWNTFLKTAGGGLLRQRGLLYDLLPHQSAFAGPSRDQSEL